MTEVEQLNEVKKGLGISGPYQDATVQRHLNDVKAFCLSAGVKEETLNSDASVGCLIRGVSDSWTQESGMTQFSLMFIQRLIQLIALSHPLEPIDG
jgi:hypothetical protein